MAGSKGTTPAGNGGEAGRIRCLYCGGNNYPSSVTCWQCGRSLQALRAQPSSSVSGSAPTPSSAAAFAAPRPAVAAVDSALAPKAAAALGMMFPYVGLPVGMVFLMLDDPRKTHLGWVTIGWSLAGTALSIVLFLVTLGPTMALLHSLIPSGGHGGGLPSLPQPGGDADGLNLLLNVTASYLFP